MVAHKVDPDDADRVARQFFVRWGLVACAKHYSLSANLEAMAALAELLREWGAPREAAERRAAVALRRAVGVCSDLDRMRGEVAAVLDDFSSMCSAPCGWLDVGAPALERFARDRSVTRCALALGHSGPHGAIGQGCDNSSWVER
jgi:hypothetical protein